MGIFDRLGITSTRFTNLASPIDLGIKSPWQTGELSQIVLSDIIGADAAAALPLSRADAMTIPAVAKARNLLVGTIQKFPLRAYDSAGPIQKQPTFLYRTDNNVTPVERMAWTVDDILFYGYALWKVTRGAKTDGAKYAPILSAEYVPSRDWKITEGRILIDEQPVQEDEVIFFNSPYEGLLTLAQRTLRGAIDQEKTWVARARNPIPMVELHVTDESAFLSATEIAEFVKAWSAARNNVNGAIGYTPEGLQLITHGENAPDMSVEGRNAIRTDVGSFTNIRASMLDGTMGIDSLTYSTTEGERNAFYEFDLPFWTDPIEARLSMDDVVPRGQRVRFDKYENYAPTPNPIGAPVED